MSSRIRTIGILSTNSAFASILADALTKDGTYRVPCFADGGTLTTFLRIAPVDAVVLDDSDLSPAIPVLARALRAHPRLASSLFKIVILTGARESHNVFLSAGADLVLPKPVTPMRLSATFKEMFNPPRQAVFGSLSSKQMPSGVGSHCSSAVGASRIGNVIPLFGEGRTPPSLLR